jgi:hypothetical protein
MTQEGDEIEFGILDFLDDRGVTIATKQLEHKVSEPVTDSQ